MILSWFLNFFFSLVWFFYSFIYNQYTVNWTKNINCISWYILTYMYIAEINTISSLQSSFYHFIIGPYFTLALHPLSTLICILSNCVDTELCIYTFCHVYYFFICFLSSIITLRFTHVVACVDSLFLFTTEQYSFCGDIPQFVYQFSGWWTLVGFFPGFHYYK